MRMPPEPEAPVRSAAMGNSVLEWIGMDVSMQDADLKCFWMTVAALVRRLSSPRSALSALSWLTSSSLRHVMYVQMPECSQRA